MTMNARNGDGAAVNGERDPRLDRLYGAATREEPPGRLDAAILAAARREVDARPRAVSPWLRAWRIPVSIAAVVVLSVSLVTLVREEGGEPLRQPYSPQPPAGRPSAQPQPPVPAVADAERARPPAAAPAPALPARGEASTADAPAIRGRVMEGITAEPGPMAPRGAEPAVAPDAAARLESRPYQDAAGGAERRASQADPAEDLAARAPAAAERRAAPLPAAPPSGPARARALPQPREEAVAAEGKLPVWHGLDSEPPQKWLERIGELKQQQRVAEAEAMLAEFRRRFPGHAVPQALQQPAD